MILPATEMISTLKTKGCNSGLKDVKQFPNLIPWGKSVRGRGESRIVASEEQGLGWGWENRDGAVQVR